MEFIWFLIVGGVAGWLAGQVMKGGGFGLLKNIIIGIIGGIFGGFVLGLVGFTFGGGIIGAILTSLIGAVLLLVIIGMIKKS